MPIDEEDSRQFKLRKKTVTVGLGELYDPGNIPIKLKKKEEPEPIITPVLEEPKSTTVLKWTKVQWKRPGEIVKEKGERLGAVTDENSANDLIKSAEEPRGGPEAPASSVSKWSQVQWASPAQDEHSVSSFNSELAVKAEEQAAPVTQASLLPNLEDIKPPITKSEEIEPSVSTGSMFRKRKIPVGSRGRQ